jgi:hypothetical protein
MPSACRSSSVFGLLSCTLLLVAVSGDAPASQPPAQVSPAAIDQSVISSLPRSNGQSADIVEHLDLTRPFETQSHWTFVAGILPGSHPDGSSSESIKGGPLARCFVDELRPHCTYATPSTDLGWFSTPLQLYSAKVVFAGADNTRPLLFIKAGSAYGGDGGHSIFSELFAYDARSNEFQSVFTNSTGSNNNQETRFIERGPLRGDVIVADPTSSAPFGYWISVYGWNGKDKYAQVVPRYRSATRYGDGNHLAVIDSEMPEILRRMGLWREGNPLPTPSGCDRPVLRHGEEWCQ